MDKQLKMRKLISVLLIGILALSLPLSCMAAVGDYAIYKLDLKCIDNFIVLNLWQTEPYNLYKNSKICKNTQVQSIYSKMAEQLTGDETEEEVYPVFESVTFEVVIDALNNGISSVEAIIGAIPDTLKEKGVDLDKYNAIADKTALHQSLSSMKYADMDDFASKLTQVISGAPVGFSDMSSAEWAREAVEALAAKGIVSGKGNNMFYPNDTVTRGEFAKMLIGALGVATSLEVEFKDVEKGAWYEKYVGGAVQSGLMNGYGEAFGVENSLTREEMATVIYRALAKNGYELTSLNTVEFADASEISDFAREAVKALSEAGIMQGMDNNMFSPKTPATRAQTAKMLYSIITIMENSKEVTE